MSSDYMGRCDGDWTVDDLASLPKDLRYELIDGRLILLSPTFFQREIAAELCSMLRPRCPTGYRPVIGVSLEVDQRNEPRPDVVVGRVADGLRSPAPIEGALLVVDVVSPTSHRRDLQDKVNLFAKAGLGSYWVVDPSSDDGVVLTEFRTGENGHYETVASTSKVFTTDVPYPITIDVPALTELRAEFRRAQS